MTGKTELRQDPLTRNWVAIAPDRSGRPNAFHHRPVEKATNAGCPFCPGHEHETPPEVWRLEGSDGVWRVRVVPNKFGVFSGDHAGAPEPGTDQFLVIPASGRHEVVIETDDHWADLPDLPLARVRDVLDAYRARYRSLQNELPALVLIFRNHGASAGTSLEHPHSQIVAMPVVPVEFQHRIDVAARHYASTGTNLYVETLQCELADGRRVIHGGERLVTFQPFASTTPMETWIMPRTPVQAFGDIADEDVEELASTLRAVLRGLREVLGDPDYNFVIASAPPGEEERGSFSWHLRILPRLTTEGGLELGSGLRVNPSVPEETAEMLRRGIAQLSGSGATSSVEEFR